MIKEMTTAALICAASSAAATTIDFSTNAGVALAHGDVITTFDFGGGVTGSLSVFNRGLDGPGEARIFDTTLSGTADPDLEGPLLNALVPGDLRNFGNSLIIQERASLASDIADDERAGGVVTFNFDRAVRLNSLTYLDGERGVSVSSGSTFLGGFEDGGSDDNLFRIIDFGGFGAANGISSLTVDFFGSGAIGQLDVAPVPLPAGLPLLLSALGGIAFLRRRRS